MDNTNRNARLGPGVSAASSADDSVLGKNTGRVTPSPDRHQDRLTAHACTEICKQCGSALPASRRLKFFCSYACRATHEMASAIPEPTGLVGSKNAKRNRALRAYKRLVRDGNTFVAVNAVTYRIDGRSKRGAGWLMQVGSGWIARIGNRASKPLPLDAAKRAALDMLRDRTKGDPVADPIVALNMAAVAEIDRVSAVLKINDDGTFQVTVRWGDEQHCFDRSLEPEDDVTDVLRRWGFRGLFALSWANGSVATFINMQKPNYLQAGLSGGADSNQLTRRGKPGRAE
jgi:hypothetical protein